MKKPAAIFFLLFLLPFYAVHGIDERMAVPAHVETGGTVPSGNQVDTQPSDLPKPACRQTATLYCESPPLFGGARAGQEAFTPVRADGEYRKDLPTTS